MAAVSSRFGSKMGSIWRLRWVLFLLDLLLSAYITSSSSTTISSTPPTPALICGRWISWCTCEAELIRKPWLALLYLSILRYVLILMRNVIVVIREARRKLSSAPDEPMPRWCKCEKHVMLSRFHGTMVVIFLAAAYFDWYYRTRGQQAKTFLAVIVNTLRLFPGIFRILMTLVSMPYAIISAYNTYHYFSCRCKSWALLAPGCGALLHVSEHNRPVYRKIKGPRGRPIKGLRRSKKIKQVAVIVDL